MCSLFPFHVRSYHISLISCISGIYNQKISSNNFFSITHLEPTNPYHVNPYHCHFSEAVFGRVAQCQFFHLVFEQGFGKPRRPQERITGEVFAELFQSDGRLLGGDPHLTWLTPGENMKLHRVHKLRAVKPGHGERLRPSLLGL